MATALVNEGFLWALEAGADLTDSVGKIVKVDSSGNAVLCGADEKAFGVVYEAALSGSAPYGPVTVQFAGVARVRASAAIAAGAQVAVAAGGLAKTGTTNPIGIALNAAGGAGEVISVALIA